MIDVPFKKWFGWVLLIIVGFIIFVAIPLMFVGQQTGRRIDCSLAEFHPDYTPAMREQCRLIRSNRLL